jgi:hypothetical protein
MKQNNKTNSEMNMEKYTLENQMKDTKEKEGVSAQEDGFRYDYTDNVDM